MTESTYEERLLAAYQEGQAAGAAGSDVSRFTPGTPMHAEWLEGWNETRSFSRSNEHERENRPDRGWQQVGDVAREVVADLAKARG